MLGSPQSWVVATKGSLDDAAGHPDSWWERIGDKINARVVASRDSDRAAQGGGKLMNIATVIQRSKFFLGV